MRKCEVCQTENELRANFCGNCGCPLHLRLCSKCETVNQKEAESCSNCGNPLYSLPVSPVGTAVEPPISSAVAVDSGTENVEALLQELEEEVRTLLIRESILELESTNDDTLLCEPVVVKEEVEDKVSIEKHPTECDAANSTSQIVAPDKRWRLRSGAERIQEKSRNSFSAEHGYPVINVGESEPHDKAFATLRRMEAWIGLLGGIAAIWYLAAFPTRTTSDHLAAVSTGNRPILANPVIKKENPPLDLASVEEKQIAVPLEAGEKLITAVPEEEKESVAKGAIAEDVSPSVSAPPPKAPESKLIIAVSPWGKVYVDGKQRGISPPLTELMLPPGRHQVEIRNADQPPYQAQISMHRGHAFRIKHKFE